MLGWITIDNQTGKSFENTRVKFVAGEISKIGPRAKPEAPVESETERVIVTGSNIPTAEAEELDEYYVYTHPAPISLKDREPKQVQFLRAEGVRSRKIYVYSGTAYEARTSGNNADLNPDSGVDSSSQCRSHGSLGIAPQTTLACRCRKVG